MKVARYNFAAQVTPDLPELLSEFRELLLQGEFELSNEVRLFEEEFARYVGVAHARSVNSGTDALTLSLRAIGAGPGMEVIAPANTFYATVAAITLSGATPVLVDADDGTYLADEDQIYAATTPRTRAVIPVHLFGKPMDIERLCSFASAREIAVVEDAAQAHGASIRGRPVGSFGVCGCFSFHMSKNLSAPGNGGAVVTNDEGIARSIEAQRRHGQLLQGYHVTPGVNSKLDAVQALVLRRKLRRLSEWNQRRRRVANFYRDSLADLPVSFQAVSQEEEHAFHLFQIRTPKRDALQNFLRHEGIDAVVRYPSPIHVQPALKDYGWREGQFPVAESLARQLLCLPIRPDMPMEEASYVVDSVKAFFASGRS